jgi:FtsP/CotA-like multicopper oxidase with cupredoxin domain
MIKSSLPRRSALKLGGGLVLAASLPRWPALAAPAVREFRLTPHAKSDASLVGAPYAATKVWSYDGSVPGPEIRLKQGERLKVVVENRLAVDTTVHWHGIRTPFGMDGVSHLTQKPIAPGGRFVYEFDVPDAGTYWYHPHERGFEQVARGLYGALIVEEPEPVKVDRDITWVLDDWRLKRDAQIDGNFDNRMDMSHGGRLGNTVTVNGRVMKSFPVRAGERIRLRLINVANARHFALEFAGHSPKIIALDGQPVTPHEPADGRIVLGPAMRADVIIDMSGAPEQKFSVTDRFYQRQEYRLLDLVYDKAPPLRAHPLRAHPLDAPIVLARNTMPEPDLKSARRHEITFGGGMMGRMRGGMLGGEQLDIREMMRRGKMWVVNGVASTGNVMDPMLTLTRGSSYILTMDNDTAWHHPIHLHGHAFRVIARNGKPTRFSEWRDTVLMAPGEKVDIAFVADNPGDWLFHCHILEHMAGGMVAVIRVV